MTNAFSASGFRYSRDQRGSGLSLFGGGLDRHRLAFGVGPISVAPRMPPPMLNEPESAELPDLQPLQMAELRITDAATRSRDDATYHAGIGLERLFGRSELTVLSFDAVREAHLEFDRVRRIWPDDPRAFLWSALTAIRMDNVNHGLELWRQSLRRLERRGNLSSLRFDFDGLSFNPQLVQQIRSGMNAFLRQTSTEMKLMLENKPAEFRTRGLALIATIEWLENNPAAAVNAARLAREEELRSLPPAQHTPGIGRLYELLKQDAESQTTAR